MLGPALFACLLAISGDDSPLIPDRPKASVRLSSPNRAGDRPFVVDRGVLAFGPENSWPAVQGAFELGAKAVRVDVRETKDGTRVLFSDPYLDRLLDGLGRLDEAYHEELILYSFANSVSHASPLSLITLDEVLQFHAEPDGLKPKLEFQRGVARLLLPGAKPGSPALSVSAEADSRADGMDTDLSAARAILETQKVPLVSDPRAIISAQGRQAIRIQISNKDGAAWGFAVDLACYQAVLAGRSNELPVRRAAARLAIVAPEAFVQQASQFSQSPNPRVRQAIAWSLGMVAKHRPPLVVAETKRVLLALGADEDPEVRADAFIACGRAGLNEVLPALLDRARIPHTRTGDDESARRRAIGYRASQAFALGLLGRQTPEGIALLEEWVRNPTLDSDEAYSALDGGMAVSALGQAKSTSSVAVLREALFRKDYPRDPSGLAAGSRMREKAFVALAAIANEEALLALETAMNAPFALELDSRFPELAAAALTRFQVSDRAPILAKLLVHSDPRVRRQGLQGALGESDPACRVLLELGAPWAVGWWDAQHALTQTPLRN
ncbi:MAG: HEAT repeat domain-containing protein [Planctomycetota bacterium]